MNFVEELRWRGMLHNIMPGAEELLGKEMVTAYLGIDPTADSLHIGHLVGVMILKHFQNCGHRPVALVGGATGMIGDPSMKSTERNLLDEATLRHNQECIKKQLERFLDFSSGKPNQALMVNNYDWMKDFSFLDFIRDVGKHITVNYMMAKDSVKKRLSQESREGMSFTEFSYQLVQGYDFLHLYKTIGCRMQLGGSDQWGNITTGTELIRRIEGGEAYAMTCPLLTKADGTKFGKTEGGNVWLDPEKTSPYKFYQYWLNTSDEDALRYIKIFTTLDRETIGALASAQEKDLSQRQLQKRLAQELTVMVHGEAAWRLAVDASAILFGKGTTETLKAMDENDILTAFKDVQQFNVPKTVFEAGVQVVELLTASAPLYPSKGELRRNIAGLQLNKIKVTDPNQTVTSADLLKGKYILAQKNKKDYCLIVAD